MTAQYHHDSADGSADDLAEGAHTDPCEYAHADIGAMNPATDPASKDGAAAGTCGAQGEKKSAPISPGRPKTFSDGVIAIAITLLGPEIKLPDSDGSLLHSLGSLWPSYLGFVLSFFLVGQVWPNHHAISVWVRSVGQWMLICSLFFLLDVTSLPLATSVLARSLEPGHDERTGAVFYGMIMVVGELFFNAP